MMSAIVAAIAANPAIEAVRADFREQSTPEVYETYLQATPTDQAYAGLRRYWDKQDESARAE
jgi:hypothetical protein